MAEETASGPHAAVRALAHVYARYGRLVDKKFTEGLSSGEVEELHEINRQLEAAEARYYAPILDALAAAQARIRARDH